MEYLGPNFLYQATHSENSLALYLSLMNSLGKVYLTSLRESKDGQNAIKVLIEKTMNAYEKYVCQNVDSDRELFHTLQHLCLSIDLSSINYCCFSNWDFTPEDVYLTDNGVRYSDPLDAVFGIPIIDMACFGGLVKLYNLPDSDKGYEEFRKFAVGKVADILHIPKGQAEKIFCLGRIFQCFMSIRFRFETNPKQAVALFQEAKNMIEMLHL